MARRDIRNIELWLQLAGDSGYSAKALCLKLARSRRQLQRYTEELFGCGPQEFLDQVRLARAPGLLEQGNPVKTVAALLGFKRAEQLSRKFSCYYGLCPSVFLAGGGPALAACKPGAKVDKFFDLFTAATRSGHAAGTGPAPQRPRGRPLHAIELSLADKAKLEQLVRQGATGQRVARRARVLLAMAKPLTGLRELAGRVDLTPQAIWALCRRYEERGLEAVSDAPRGGRPP
ncbi:MAG: helix-turn-helix domain-containing protein [Verrucomicrobiota bacterium]|jgi:AraC-like DNA-binding protein